MCDYSLQHVISRPAKIGDQLLTCNFGLGTGGFTPKDQIGVAVCLLPGTELAFADHVVVRKVGFWRTSQETISHRMAMFRQVDPGRACRHHDALEFPDGRVVLLTALFEGQQATVLQLPASAKTVAEDKPSEGVSRQPPNSLPRMLPPLAQNTSATPISEPPAMMPDATGKVSSSASLGVRRSTMSAMRAPRKNKSP